MLDSVTMARSPSQREQVSALESTAHGLRKNALSPLETLAQSISSIAPTAGPTLLIPLVFAIAGNGAWLSYLFATVALFFVALNVSAFARHSASPGSLYAYTASVFPGAVGRLSAWALLIAYLATAAAVTGGFTNYTNVLLQWALHKQCPPLLLTALAVLSSTWIAYRDIKISARVMLWFEAVSVTLISAIVLATLWKDGGPRLDFDQITLKGVSSGGLRLGLVLAMFSFVGFESATTLGEEAKNPLRTVPRAVILSAVLSGVFFIACAYIEVLGFRAAHQNLAQNTTPLHMLAERVGLRILSPLIDLGAVFSFFACCLSCIIAAARVFLIMAQDGLVNHRLGHVHRRNATPGTGVITAGVLSFLPAALLVAGGTSGFDVNGWMGSLATYGFITAYILVSIATPFYLRERNCLSATAVVISAVATLFMALAFAGSIYPLPPWPYSWLFGVYLIYIAAGFTWTLLRKRPTAPLLPETPDR